MVVFFWSTIFIFKRMCWIGWSHIFKSLWQVVDWIVLWSNFLVSGIHLWLIYFISRLVEHYMYQRKSSMVSWKCMKYFQKGCNCFICIWFLGPFFKPLLMFFVHRFQPSGQVTSVWSWEDVLWLSIVCFMLWV